MHTTHHEDCVSLGEPSVLRLRLIVLERGAVLEPGVGVILFFDSTSCFRKKDDPFMNARALSSTTAQGFPPGLRAHLGDDGPPLSPRITSGLLSLPSNLSCVDDRGDPSQGTWQRRGVFSETPRVLLVVRVLHRCAAECFCVGERVRGC